MRKKGSATLRGSWQPRRLECENGELRYYKPGAAAQHSSGYGKLAGTASLKDATAAALPQSTAKQPHAVAVFVKHPKSRVYWFALESSAAVGELIEAVTAQAMCHKLSQTIQVRV